MKKIIATVCLAAMLLSSLPVAFAADDTEPIEGVEVVISPMEFKLPPQPIIKN